VTATLADTLEARTQPHDTGAERVVLGAMMQTPNIIPDIIPKLTGPEDFYEARHATIYQAILELHTTGQPADTEAVLHRLLTTGARIPDAGPYLHTLLESVPLAVMAPWHAQVIRTCAQLRHLIEAGTRIVQLGYNPTSRDDMQGTLSRATKLLLDATTANTRGDLTHIRDALPGLLEAMDEAAANTERPSTAISTGFIDLDKLLGGGNRPGNLVIVAGRPGIGKSVAATDFARAAGLHQPHNVAYFSLEMSTGELVERIVAAESGTPLSKIREGGLTDNEWTRVARKTAHIDEVPGGIWIDDTPRVGIAEIHAKARRLAARVPLKMIVVDYLQLMETPKTRNDNRERAVADLSRELKLLGKELGCIVVAVCQLNRGPEGRTDKRPTLGDLRESGSLEQDADSVLLIYREDYYKPETERAGEAEFILAKSRHGPTGTVDVAAQLHLSRFSDLAAAATY
jgi:replicative DNA helicase